MARGDSLLNRKNMKIFSEELAQPKEEVAEVQIDELPKKSKPKQAKKPSLINKFVPKETVVRTYVVRKDVADLLEELVTDPDTGKRVGGTKGLISKIANNAIVKELVDLGLMEESELDSLESY